MFIYDSSSKDERAAGGGGVLPVPVPFSIVAVASGRSKRLHNDGTEVVLSVGRSKSGVRMGKERVSAESAKRERAWRHICIFGFYLFSFSTPRKALPHGTRSGH